MALWSYSSADPSKATLCPLPGTVRNILFEFAKNCPIKDFTAPPFLRTGEYPAWVSAMCRALHGQIQVQEIGRAC